MIDVQLQPKQKSGAEADQQQQQQAPSSSHQEEKGKKQEKEKSEKGDVKKEEDKSLTQKSSEALGEEKREPGGVDKGLEGSPQIGAAGTGAKPSVGEHADQTKTKDIAYPGATPREKPAPGGGQIGDRAPDKKKGDDEESVDVFNEYVAPVLSTSRDVRQPQSTELGKPMSVTNTPASEDKEYDKPREDSSRGATSIYGGNVAKKPEDEKKKSEDVEITGEKADRDVVKDRPTMAESAKAGHVEVVKAEDMLKSMDLKKDQTRDPKYDEKNPDETKKDQPTKVESDTGAKHETQKKEKPEARGKPDEEFDREKLGKGLNKGKSDDQPAETSTLDTKSGRQSLEEKSKDIKESTKKVRPNEDVMGGSVDQKGRDPQLSQARPEQADEPSPGQPKETSGADKGSGDTKRSFAAVVGKPPHAGKEEHSSGLVTAGSSGKQGEKKESEKKETKDPKVDQSGNVKKPSGVEKEQKLEQPEGDMSQQKKADVELGRKGDLSQPSKKSEKTSEQEGVTTSSVSKKDKPSGAEPESISKVSSSTPEASSDQQDKQDVSTTSASTKDQTKGGQPEDVSTPASTGKQEKTSDKQDMSSGGKEDKPSVDKSSTADTPVEENIGDASKVPSKEEKGEKKIGEKKEGEDNISPDVMEGKWKLTKTENYDEYLKAAGINIISRNIAPLENWLVEFKKLADDRWKVITNTTLNSGEWEFKFDEETEEVTLDGRKCMTTMSWDNGVLTQKRAGQEGDKGGVVTRKFNGDVMQLVAKVEDVACVRIYERESETEA